MRRMIAASTFGTKRVFLVSMGTTRGVTCVCCGGACDEVFKVLEYTVCFDCKMHKSWNDIMHVIQQRLSIDVNTWGIQKSAAF